MLSVCSQEASRGAAELGERGQLLAPAGAATLSLAPQGGGRRLQGRRLPHREATAALQHRQVGLSCRRSLALDPAAR